MMRKLDEEVPVEKLFNQDEFRPTVIAFLASWCPRCRAFLPTLEELANDLEGRVLFYLADEEKHKALAERFEVSGVPTLILLQEGEIKSESVGVRSKQELLSWIF